MRCFTWSGGTVTAGIALTPDERLGQVIFLGEAGRGRRYEKIALGRRNPAEVVDGRVLEAHPVKITLPPKDGKPEKAFFVLERPHDGGSDLRTLVRVSTRWCYTKSTCGVWETVAGAPEILVYGYGAHGDAGRIGNWNDGLIVMKPGDVLRVQPEGGYKISTYALWVGEDGWPVTATWQDYENLQAVAKAEATIAEAAAKPAALEVVFGQMPAFTWVGGKITRGLKVTKGATGPVVAFGESGRGRCLLEVPLVGFEPGETVERAAVAKLDEKVTPARYSWEQPTIKTIYGLTQTAKSEPACLVQVCTGHGYTRRGCGKWEPHKGNPILLSQGSGADGDAGGIGSWADGLFVLREGDVLWAVPSGGCPAYAIWVEGGELKTQLWITWKAEDGQRDPAFYVAKGTAPWGHTPAEWIGQVVTVTLLQRERGRFGEEDVLTETHTGELISVSSDRIVLNLGWDGRDRHDVTVWNGTWVKVEADKPVRRLDNEEADKRHQAQARGEELRKLGEALLTEPYFHFLPPKLGARISKMAKGQEEWGDSALDFALATTAGILQWTTWAESVIAEAHQATAEAQALQARQSVGEILVGFEAWHRLGAVSGCGDGWVIRTDGTRREPDGTTVPRHKSDGTYRWERVEPEELALRWSCETGHDVTGSSQFEIVHRPVNGTTSEQLATVGAIEDELGVLRGAFGLDESLNPLYAQRLAEIIGACARSRTVTAAPTGLTFLQAAGSWGAWVPRELICQFGESIGTTPSGRSVHGRDSFLVESLLAADGMVEFLAFHRGGEWNLHLVWRERQAGDPFPTPTPPPADPAASSKPPSTDAMASLKAKFGGNR